MRKLRAGIVGCGGIANGKHLPAMQKSGLYEVVAFCDIIIERAQETKEKFGTEDAKVFEDYQKGLRKEGNFRFMGSDTFFYGLRVGETSDIKIAEGKILTVKLIEVKELDEEGFREVVFEVNGNRRTVSIKDQGAKAQAAAASVVMADPDNEKEIGANIPGTILKVLVKEGEKVEANQPIAVIEAMKMETNILAPVSGEVDKIYVNDAQQVKSGELIATLK